MAIITYPLNGIDYDAENAETYLCTRTSGVYSAEGNFQASVTGDRQVSISAGLAWIQNTEFAGKSVCNTESVAVEIPLADGTRPRIDRIVLRFDKAANASSVVLKQGTPSSTPAAPTVERTELVYELGLCTVQVPAASTIVSAGNVTSTLLDESVCGLMRDGVTGIPTEQLQEQVTTLLADLRVAFENQLDLQEQDFDAWFETIKGKLEDDPATALQAQVDDLQAAVGGMPLELSAGSNSVQITADENRLESVKVAGFTTQTGSGDPSPSNVRPIDNAGLFNAIHVMTGEETLVWNATHNTLAIKGITTIASGPGISAVGAVDVYGACASTDFIGAGVFSSSGVKNIIYSQPAYNQLIISNCTYFSSQQAAQEFFRQKYAAGNPTLIVYRAAEQGESMYTCLKNSTANGTSVCSIIKLTEPLHDGDTLETNVQSEFDLEYTFDGTEDWVSASSSYQSAFKLLFKTGGFVAGIQASNNYQQRTSGTIYANDGCYVNPDTIFITDSSVKSVSDFKALLASKKTANNPVRLFCKAVSGGTPKNIKREEHAKKTYVLTGTESNLVYSEKYKTLAVRLNNIAGDITQEQVPGVVKCSHFKTNVPVDGIQAQPKYGQISISGATVFDGLESAKAYFAQQYAAGTPVTIEYELAQPEVFADTPVEVKNPRGAFTVSSEESTTLTVAISAPVGRINGKSGASVTLTKADIGLSSVDNTPDAQKNVKGLVVEQTDVITGLPTGLYYYKANTPGAPSTVDGLLLALVYAPFGVQLAFPTNSGIYFRWAVDNWSEWARLDQQTT